MAERLMTTETNCLDCEGSITVVFDFEAPEPDIGFRGGIEIQEVTPNDDCTCIEPRTTDEELGEHAEEAAGQHVLQPENQY